MDRFSCLAEHSKTEYEISIDENLLFTLERISQENSEICDKLEDEITRLLLILLYPHDTTVLDKRRLMVDSVYMDENGKSIIYKYHDIKSIFKFMVVSRGNNIKYRIINLKKYIWSYELVKQMCSHFKCNIPPIVLSDMTSSNHLKNSTVHQSILAIRNMFTSESDLLIELPRGGANTYYAYDLKNFRKIEVTDFNKNRFNIGSITMITDEFLDNLWNWGMSLEVASDIGMNVNRAHCMELLRDSGLRQFD